jgi:hypothetical protein
MFWNSLETFDGSDLVSWLDERTQQRITAFFQQIRAKELDESFRHKKHYLEYLKKPLWTKEIRARKLERDKHVCRCCGGEATLVHHRSYAPEVMRGENDEMLASLCEGCHNYIEFDEFGNKRTNQEEKDRLFLAGRPDVDYPAPKVDFRTTSPQHPGEWNCMSATQRSLWSEQYNRLRERRLSAKANLTARDRVELELLRRSLRSQEPD